MKRSQGIGLIVVYLVAITGFAQPPGVDSSTIRLGSVMVMKDISQNLGLDMLAGLQAGLAQSPYGRQIVIDARNDYNNPTDTRQLTEELLDQGVFAMVGNVGSATTKAALPLLRQARVPMVGFYTGTTLLRTEERERVINVRPSYAQEVAQIIRLALRQGFLPNQICAFVQNDALGFEGLRGIYSALVEASASADYFPLLEEMIQQANDESFDQYFANFGTYQRNALGVSAGYRQLKEWEALSGHPCRLIVTAGSYSAVADFIVYSREKQQEPWIYSAISYTGSANLAEALVTFNSTAKVIMTEVMPPLTADLAIVDNAYRKLGSQLNRTSLEGYIVGRLTAYLLNEAGNPPSREQFIAAAQNRRFSLEGLEFDFTDDNQGLDQVYLTYYMEGRFYDVIPIGFNYTPASAQIAPNPSSSRVAAQ